MRFSLILGTVAENFWQGYETFPLFCGDLKISRVTFHGVQKYLLEKFLDGVIDQRLKERLTDIWK